MRTWANAEAFVGTSGWCADTISRRPAKRGGESQRPILALAAPAPFPLGYSVLG
ncbi:hypothetical protein G7067_09940 [Leucobacter insecticola]|uniref:Uncharacterized protein n=1 Tax=Leucobacter insecticola TaxID=2714934 RepID=A0A6G8FJX3_9MICO|nr:hypothetical protein G7067_09940 [Leucobacter insecticola]